MSRHDRAVPVTERRDDDHEYEHSPQGRNISFSRHANAAVIVPPREVSSSSA